MGYLIIHDLGFLTKDRAGSPAPVQFNGGEPAAFVGSASVSLKSGVSVDDSPQLGSRQYPGTSLGSANVTQFTVSLSFNQRDSSDQDLITELLGVYGSSSTPGIDKTEGVKALYYSDTANSAKELVELVGAVDTPFHGLEIPSSRPAVLVRVTKVSASPTPSSKKFPVTLTCEVA